ncbi:MAG: peptidoglycan-binding protein [Clostridium sp.]|uniref:peptidoglycan-binding protein n=1 Tax=Clostridium sp. TaxID=1506 RepID=UPI003D6D4172
MIQLIISIGSTGEAVNYLQQSLAKLGYNLGQVDGVFGSKTETAVKLFQKDNALAVDGIVGDITWAAIDKALATLFTIKDYFVNKENTKYVYEGIGSDYASYSVFVDYLAGNLVQLRHADGGMDIIRVLENKDGKLTMLLSMESDYRENFTNNPISKSEVLLQEPLIKGTTWTISDNRKRYISNVEANVTTPLGKYKALEVTTEGTSTKNLDYYVPNIGLVKTVSISNGSEISSSLSKIENNALFSQFVEFYYPNVDETTLNYVFKQLTFRTNDITRTKIETGYKDVPIGNIFRALGPNAKIKSLYINKDTMAYVDFSKEIITEMNTGAGYEVQVLQCITNTVGRYYSVNKISFTVEGIPYASGHVSFERDEAFIVDFSNSIELK